MNRNIKETPKGVTEDTVHQRERDRENAALDRGITANMHDDPAALAGERPLGSAALAALERYSGKDGENKKRDEFHQTLILLNDYLDRLDQILEELRQELADLYEKRQAAIERMEQLFEEAHDIEDLIAGIKKDGMSPDEAQAAAKLLGKKVDGQSPEEIVILLGALQRKKEAEGREASGDVEGLDAKIAEAERQIYAIEQAKEKGLEAQADHDYANVVSFNNNAEDYFAKLATVNSENDVEQKSELNAEIKVTRDSGFIAEPEFGF